MKRFDARWARGKIIALCLGAFLVACDRGEQPASDIDDRDGSPVTDMAVLDRRIESGKMTSGEPIVAEPGGWHVAGSRRHVSAVYPDRV